MVDPATIVAELAPTLGFLAALLLLGEGCRREGVFEWLGGLIAAARDSRRRFGRVFAAATAVTVVLSLDATIVLLAPVALAAARRARSDSAPPAFACLHLANAGSLLLPISNLTGLLVVGQTDLGFLRFAALMALPWVVALAVEWVVLRRAFRAELADEPAAPSAELEAPRAPRLALAVLALALGALLASAAVGVSPAWPALAGGSALVALGSHRDGWRPGALIAALQPLFLLGVAALGVGVAALGELGASELLAGLMPSGQGTLALLAICGLAALLANVVNNIPATLLLLPVLVPLGEGALLAALIGLNVGPNLTPWGSLATVLWRRILGAEDTAQPTRRLVGLGLATVPAILVGSTLALSGALAVIG